MSVAASFSHSEWKELFLMGFGVRLFLVCYVDNGHNYTEGIGNCGDGVGLCGGGKRFPILYTGDYGKTKRIPCHFVGVLAYFPPASCIRKIWEVTKILLLPLYGKVHVKKFFHSYSPYCGCYFKPACFSIACSRPFFYASAMIRNDNGFMSVCVLQFYMGAILAGNRKTVS